MIVMGAPARRRTQYDLFRDRLGVDDAVSGRRDAARSGAQVRKILPLIGPPGRASRRS
jgi:hypothetical protein